MDDGLKILVGLTVLILVALVAAWRLERRRVRSEDARLQRNIRLANEIEAQGRKNSRLT